jgi:hypothetical protein
MRRNFSVDRTPHKRTKRSENRSLEVSALESLLRFTASLSLHTLHVWTFVTYVTTYVTETGPCNERKTASTISKKAFFLFFITYVTEIKTFLILRYSKKIESFKKSFFATYVTNRAKKLRKTASTISRMHKTPFVTPPEREAPPPQKKTLPSYQKGRFCIRYNFRSSVTKTTKKIRLDPK